MWKAARGCGVVTFGTVVSYRYWHFDNASRGLCIWLTDSGSTAIDTAVEAFRTKLAAAITKRLNINNTNDVIAFYYTLSHRTGLLLWTVWTLDYKLSFN